MNFLFLSQTYPSQILPELEKHSKVILDYAGHNLGSAIISGFKANNAQVHVVNTPHVGSYPPYYNSPFVPNFKDETIDSIGYLNVSYLKRLSIARQQKCKVLKWCKDTPGEKVVFMYNFEPLCFAKTIKQKYPDTKIVLIVTDLIEYQSTGLTPLKRINKVIEKVIGGGTDVYDNLQYVDAFVLLAPMMTENLNVGNRPWIQVEGIYNNDNKIADVPKASKRTLLYTGNLGKRYGICELLEAFSRIKDDNYELQICGGGDGLDEIKRYAAADSRIKYLGIIPRSEVQVLQKAATVLINPRNSKDDYTMYSFPSKTMEYLASGTPVIMSHLKSIPQEYNEHIFYVEDETIDGWTKRIVEVCSKEQTELDNHGRCAQKFIMETKTPAFQSKRIIDFIEKL